MTPQLLKLRQDGYNAELSFANKDLALYNNLLAGIKAAVPSLVVTQAVLQSLLANPQLYAYNTLIGANPVTLGGQPVPQAQAINLITYPAGWLTVIALANAFNLDYATNTVYQFPPPFDASYKVNRLSIANIVISGSVFVLTAAYLAQLNTNYSIYTTSDKQNNILAALNTLYPILTNLKTLGASCTSAFTLKQLGVFEDINGNFVFDPTLFVSAQ